MKFYEIIALLVIIAVYIILFVFALIKLYRFKNGKTDNGEKTNKEGKLHKFVVRFLDWVEERKRKQKLKNEVRKRTLNKKSSSSNHKNQKSPRYTERTKCEPASLISKPKKHNGKCNGDCANCPPHYGYRHGRWYYGHNHIEGCEFGGNKGSGGRD